MAAELHLVDPNATNDTLRLEREVTAAGRGTQMAMDPASRGGAAELKGRGRECDVLERLIEAVRAGEGGALVLRGEPGVGKTALLDYVVAQASGCRVVRAAGVQSEIELAFAGLHQLLAPMLDRVGRLARPQRDALRTAFGVGPGSVPGRLFVGLAVLSLLSEVAEERPLICVVDDEQWLDRASAQGLAFVARRLEAESVGLVFAARGNSDELAGLPELVVETALHGAATPGADRLLHRIRTLVEDGRRDTGASRVEREARRQEIDRLKARLAELVRQTAAAERDKP